MLFESFLYWRSLLESYSTVSSLSHRHRSMPCSGRHSGFHAYDVPEDPWIHPARLMKNAHLLRFPLPSTLRCTVKYASLLRTQGACIQAFLNSLEKTIFHQLPGVERVGKRFYSLQVKARSMVRAGMGQQQGHSSRILSLHLIPEVIISVVKEAVQPGGLIVYEHLTLHQLLLPFYERHDEHLLIGI